jgi:uncharacterized protein involved in exopolysaccharide biosynthesis
MQAHAQKRSARPVILSVVLIAVLTVIGATLGYLGGQVQGRVYTSTARLLWDPSSLRYTDSSAYVPDSVSLELQVAGQTERILSDAVIIPVSEQLDTSVKELRKAVSASVEAGSTLMTVSAEADSASEAQTIATAVVAAYSESVESTIAAQYTGQSEALSDSIARVRKELDDVEAESALESSLASQLATLTSQQEQLNAKAAAAPTPLSLIQEASLPEEPSNLSPLVLAIVGGGIGFLIGAVVTAMVGIRRRNRVVRGAGASASQQSELGQEPASI